MMNSSTLESDSKWQVASGAAVLFDVLGDLMACAVVCCDGGQAQSGTVHPTGHAIVPTKLAVPVCTT